MTDYELAQTALAAYQDNHFIPEFDTTFISRNGTQCHVHSNSVSVIVAFRGTQEIEDILTDIQAFKTFKKELAGEIHSGFNKAFDDILIPLHAALKKFIRKGIHVTFTGHSLGGALAILAGIWWERNGGLVDRIVTFGAPRVFNSEAAFYYDSSLKFQTTRYEASGDIIPYIPLLSMGYRHVGECTYLSDFKILENTWFVRRLFGLLKLAKTQGRAHSMKNYVSLLGGGIVSDYFQTGKTTGIPKTLGIGILCLLFSGCTATVSSDWTNINYSFGIHEERGVFVDIKPPMWDAAVQGAKVIKKMVEDENE